jgi:NitT/TauT family transport system ATP-binding protein
MRGAAVLEVAIEEKSFAASTGASRAVLRDVRFRAEAGEVAALLGPSGIGKSTVLAIVLGLDRNFQGTARLDCARVGVVFQEPRLLPWLTVADNLRLVRPGLSLREIEALCAEVMLADVAQLRPAQLSLGMARRVALARALAVDPDALVLDEVFASLDRGLGDLLAGRLAERARARKMLMLASMHDLDRALAVADRVLVLDGAPATLAADMRVEAGTREMLLARFPFLGSDTGPAG